MLWKQTRAFKKFSTVLGVKKRGLCLIRCTFLHGSSNTNKFAFSWWCSSSAVFLVFIFSASFVFELQVFIQNALFSQGLTSQACVMEKNKTNVKTAKIRRMRCARARLFHGSNVWLSLSYGKKLIPFYMSKPRNLHRELSYKQKKTQRILKRFFFLVGKACFSNRRLFQVEVKVIIEN